MKDWRPTAAAAALAVLALAAPVSKGRAATENPRETAWKLAEAAIKESGPRRFPDFTNWAIPREIFPCGLEPRSRNAALSAPDLFDESFHYNPEAAARLCAPLTRASG